VKECWKEFLKEEKLKARLHLKKSVNEFIEKWDFIEFKWENRTYISKNILYFKYGEKEITIKKTTAIYGKFYPGDSPPITTWSYFLDGEELLLEDEGGERLQHFFEKLIQKFIEKIKRTA